MTKANVKIIINGGVNQIIPRAERTTQYIYTKDGKTVIVNDIKIKK